ncbi:hypothetical protein D3C77_306490 [compost metagenome]
MPAPIAAALGSSSKNTSLAPLRSAASRIDFCSTEVIFVGAQIRIRGRLYQLRAPTRSMKYLSIISVISKSAITPSLRGRIATIFPGVRPTIFLASSPTASTRLASLSIATTDGSSNTTPLPFTCISTLAVPKSIPISLLIIVLP